MRRCKHGWTVMDFERGSNRCLHICIASVNGQYYFHRPNVLTLQHVDRRKPLNKQMATASNCGSNEGFARSKQSVQHDGPAVSSHPFALASTETKLRGARIILWGSLKTVARRRAVGVRCATAHHVRMGYMGSKTGRPASTLSSPQSAEHDWIPRCTSVFKALRYVEPPYGGCAHASDAVPERRRALTSVWKAARIRHMGV